MTDNNYEQFKHYMLAGHGRAFKLLEDNERFREFVLYGCLNNLAFDMQCEGSRACFFMYNLVLQFDDYEKFLNPTIEKFLSSEINEDDRTIWHLCDFIDNFAADGDISAKKAILKKYDDLYSLIMVTRFSRKTNNIIQSFEYLAITVMQHSSFERAVKIFSDIGAYFLRRRKTSDDDLKWHFAWFYHNAQEKYGKEFLKERLELHGRNSKEIRRFSRVMNCLEKEFKRIEYPKPTADKFIEKAVNLSVMRKDIMLLRRAEKLDILKIANAFLSENDLDIKEKLLSAFTSRYNPFPLDPTPILECAKSENKKLRKTAIYALKFLRADCVHDFAIEMLKENFSVEMIEILIHNYRDENNDFILGFLEDFTFDLENESGWHSIVSEILTAAEEMEISEELLYFVYEKSLCSCCRANAFYELKNRNLLTDEMISECLWDCNEEIRNEAMSLT